MERIKLNLIPSGVAPIVHLSQYDDGRQFGIDLFEGESVYVLDGTEMLTVNSRKPDGHVVVITVTNTGTSSLDVDTVEQLTAVHGASYAKLQIVKGSVTIATLPFLIDVSRDPLENGDPSETFIQNLHTQIAEGVAEEVATQYDSANVIFDNEPTDNHGIGYTVTSEGIKTAIDNAFDYDNTASGSLVHIEDGADNIPVKSLVSEIVAVESGSGVKSPTNPYTISGFDSGVVSVCGKNLLSGTLEDYQASTRTYGLSTFIAYKLPNGNYTISTNAPTGYIWAGKSLDNGSLDASSYLRVYDGNPLTITLSGTQDLIVGVLTTDKETACSYNTMVNIGSSPSSYHAYNGTTYTFTFGQTVYGGHFDNKGNLVSTKAIVDLGSLSWTYHAPSGDIGAFFDTYLPSNSIVGNRDVAFDGMSEIYNIIPSKDIALSGYDNNVCALANATRRFITCDQRFTDATSYKNAMNGVMLVYPLATPITLSITSQDIPTLLSENNIFSNCGDVEVTYYTNKANDILEFVDSEIGKKNGTNIPIEANSQDSIKTYIDDEVSTINTSLSNKANKTEDGTITVTNGCTLISSSCGKTDRLVHLNFNVEKTGGFTTGWQVIGTTDFKPNTLAYCPLWNVTNGVGNGEVRIDTDGTINFYVVTAGELRLNANIGYITN